VSTPSHGIAIFTLARIADKPAWWASYRQTAAKSVWPLRHHDNNSSSIKQSAGVYRRSKWQRGGAPEAKTEPAGRARVNSGFAAGGNHSRELP
jgi:hypothetical protein